MVYCCITNIVALYENTTTRWFLNYYYSQSFKKLLKSTQRATQQSLKPKQQSRCHSCFYGGVAWALLVRNSQQQWQMDGEQSEIYCYVLH